MDLLQPFRAPFAVHRRVNDFGIVNLKSRAPNIRTERDSKWYYFVRRPDVITSLRTRHCYGLD